MCLRHHHLYQQTDEEHGLSFYFSVACTSAGAAGGKKWEVEETQDSDLHLTTQCTGRWMCQGREWMGAFSPLHRDPHCHLPPSLPQSQGRGPSSPKVTTGSLLLPRPPPPTKRESSGSTHYQPVTEGGPLSTGTQPSDRHLNERKHPIRPARHLLSLFSHKL